MELKTKLLILGIIFFLVTTGFSLALIWMTKVVEKKALAKKAAERDARKQNSLPDQNENEPG